MGRIFLSYAREDRTCAERLARVLQGAGHEVWWDRRLDGGEEFSAEIEAALNKSEVVLVAWSKESVTSRWVRDEAAVGADAGRLVPVSIDASMPPMGFRQFHTLDLNGWKGAVRDRRTADLIQAVDRRLSGKQETQASEPIARRRQLSLPSGKRLWAIAGAILFAAVVAVVVFFLTNHPEKTDAPLKPTIALLPFNIASPDPELRELAAQARGSIAHTFSQSGVPLRLMDSAPQDGRSAVDFLITGDFTRKGDKVVATIRLDEAAHAVTVYSHQFEADREVVRELPERIGVQLAETLTGNDTMLTLDRRNPLDPALIADLLSNQDYLGDPLQAYQIAKRIAAKAPNVQIAQLSVAFDTSFALSGLPRDERDEAVAEARRAADRAIVLGSKFGDAYSPWCLLHSETRLAECEDRLRAGRRIDPDAPWLNTFLSHLLRNVGRVGDAMDVARLSYTHDMYVPQKIAWMLRMLEYADDSDEARKLHQQGARWWPDYKPMFFRNRLFGLINRGDFQAMQRLEQEVGAKNLLPDYATTDPLVAALRAKSIAGAKQACPATAGEILKIRCMLIFAMLGDRDGAYAIADELYPRRVGRTPAETERIWLDNPDGAGGLEFITSPAAAPMRRDSRYLALAERTGLLAYWRSGRLPDFCRDKPEPICAQIRRR